MAKDYTNQHIVPKRYLDRFGTKDGKRTIIGTRIVVKGKPKFFTDATANVGYVKNYYDVTDKKDPKYWEHFFAEKIDSLCGSDMQNLIARITLSKENTIVLSAHDKEVLSKIIIAQLFRVPECFEYVTSQIYPKVLTKHKEDFLAALPQFLLDKFGDQLRSIEFSEQYQKELVLNHAFAPENFDRYCKVLQEGVWMVYLNAQRSVMPFITSDNPVLVEGIGKKETGIFPNGLANPATCIFYPLSPGIAVAIYSRGGIMGLAADAYDGRKIILDEMKYIVDKNTKIMAQAHHHTFIPQPLFDEINDEKRTE